MRINPEDFIWAFHENFYPRNSLNYMVNFFLFYTMIAENKDVVSRMQRDIAVKLMCLTMFCKSTWAPLKRSCCTTAVWPLSLACMRAVHPSWGMQWDKTVLSQWWTWKRQLKGGYLPWSTNYMRQSITLIPTSRIHISHILVQQCFQNINWFYVRSCSTIWVWVG